MAEITVELQPAAGRLHELGVADWPVWVEQVSEFPWHYDEQEICYFLEGRATVTPEGGKPVTVGKGALVTLPQGMSCSWIILKPVRKHYRSG